MKIKVPTGLVTYIASQREKRNRYETHRGFKALAFYLQARSLTTSNGIYAFNDECRSSFHDRLAYNMSLANGNNEVAAKVIKVSHNTVRSHMQYAHDFGFIEIQGNGFKFVSLAKIYEKLGIFCPTGQIEYRTIELNGSDSLEHILKALVIQENFDRQQYSVKKKLNKIPGIEEMFDRYINNWKSLSTKQLLKRIVEVQKQTFVNYAKGTAAYDFFHRIHADIALSVGRIASTFSFKSRASSMYLKQVLANMGLITVEKREVVSSTASRFPHEPDGSLKPITLTWMHKEKKRKWIQPDLITVTI